MASRRGLSNNERLGLSMAHITATGAIVAAPCYVYSINARVSDSTTTAVFAVGNTSGAADLVKESTRLSWKLGTGAASGNFVGDGAVRKSFVPPIYCETQLFWANSTGIDSVCVEYLPAS